jgi:hypothetical protein
MFRKIFILFTIILFLVISGITAFRINRSISPLSIAKTSVSDSVLVHDFSDYQIIPPLMSDSDKIFLTIQNPAGEVFISGLDPLRNELFVYKKISSKTTRMSGFAKDPSARFFMFHSTDTFALCFLLNNDSTFVLFNQPTLFREKITSVNFSQGRPEIATIVDTVPSYFRLHSLQLSDNMHWQQKSIRRNPFFISISTPLAAYYRNAWHYLSASAFFRRDSLYVNTPSGTSNIMVFQNNLSYHMEDIRVQESSFNAGLLDMTFTGMFSMNTDSSDQYSFNPEALTLEKSQWPEEAKTSLPLFHTVNGYPERFLVFRTQSSDTIVFANGETTKHLCVETEEDKNKSIFIIPENDDSEFARINGHFSDIFLLPFQDGYIFLLDNGQFCLLDHSFERKDNIEFVSKVTNFSLKYFYLLLNKPSQLRSWAMPASIAGLPVLTLLMLFFFFIARVFLTPRRPAYSSRKQKKTPFYVFWFPACLLWFVFTGITLLYFFSEIKIL